MKMKKKIMAILTILLLVAMPISIADASEEVEEQNNETISVEFATIEDDGKYSTQIMSLSEEELVQLENIITLLIEEIQSTQNWDGIEDAIDKLLGGNHPLLNIILKAFPNLKTSVNRAFVISSGHSYKFNPLKKNDFKIRKNLAIWHYSSDKLIKDRTIIFQPLSLNMKIIKDTQFGMMTKFTGVHIFIARKMPQKSYTFFMGTARHINGIQVLPGK